MKTFQNNLIIIGSTLPYNFPADYIKQTAQILSKKNRVIIFLWGNALSIKEIINKKKDLKITEKSGNILLFTPIHFVPFRRFEFIRQINLFINSLLLKIYINFVKFRKFDFSKRIIWVFNHEFYNWPKYMDINYLSLYDCVEYPSSLDKKTEKEIRWKEKKLINSINHFFVNSPTLKRIYKQFPSIVVPQGFDLETFIEYKNYRLHQTIKIPIDKPVIGCVGSINFRLDYPLLINLIKNNPQWNFAFVGQIQKNTLEDKYSKTFSYLNKLLKLKNFIHISNQPKHKIPVIIKQFSICLIPYNIEVSFNRYCYPMKLFEYFYLGKPVISTPIKSLVPLQPYVIIAKNAKEFEQKIKHLLKNGWPKKYQQKQKKLAIINSWKEKINQISQI